MIIQIPLGGQIRRIKWDGAQFAPLPVTGDAALAYCTVFGNAVAHLVKDVARVDSIQDGETKHEVLTLQQFVERFERILGDIKNLKPEDFNIEIPAELPKKVTKRAPTYPTVPVDDDIDDL